ncbi:MAG: FAD-binding protein [Xanthomonadales bacterium]|jgi:predicted oxidoreductase|nr:FAD-binding protein [Xanthomonadales bacterium]
METSDCSKKEYQAQNLVIGGGIAGIVTALGLLDDGQTVVLADADTPDRFGGLALWAFGGMALSGTPEQKRMSVDDSPERLLEDWVRFGELENTESWPLAWARCYAGESRELVYDWVKSLGLKFMPAVNFVERGERIKGNSVPRYHVLWGTGRELVRVLIGKLLNHPQVGKLTLLHEYRATGLIAENGRVQGCVGVCAEFGCAFAIRADNTIVATGGINGSVEKVREHWLPDWPGPPDEFLNGANPHSDGAMHESAAAIGARLDHLGDMWNYAAGVPHPQPHFAGHGLSLIPPKTCLWLDPDGKPIGPDPMVTGFDTNGLCRQVVNFPYTWQVLNRKIARRELAISGAEHNPNIVRHKTLGFLKDMLLGNKRLVDQMLAESAEFLSAPNWKALAKKMNALSGENRIRSSRLKALGDDYDAAMADPGRHADHPQISRIIEARKWRTEKLRTCKLQPIGDKKAGPLIAIRLRFISRKSLGGLQTDLECRVLDTTGKAIPGLYAVGEAAGFGGGGASGKRSLEGTFLSGCILTARKAAQAIRQA